MGMSSWGSALVVYAEPLVVGRRVMVLGSAADGVAEWLVRLGARSVHVFEPRPTGDVLAAHQVVVSALPEGDFDVRDGAFDLAIVADIDALADATVWLARLRRVLGAQGALLVATRHVEQEAYYRLYDLVALQFASVVMLAEVPFSGVAIAELGRADDVDVSVDTQLMDEPREPLAFVALASQEAVHLAPYAIVESPADKDSFQTRIAEEPAALAEARLQADLQGTQLEEERARRQDLERDLHKLSDMLTAEKAARAAAERAASHAEDAIGVRERVAILETSLQIAEAAVEVLSERLVRAEESLQRKSEDALVLLAEIDAMRSLPPPSVPPGEIEDALAQLHDAHAAEIHAMEERLRERAATVALLEHDARARERAAREMVAQLEEADTGLGSRLVDEAAELRKKLDAAALAAARRESDLEARGWRIAELESRLLQMPKQGPKTALESEIDALRQALTQEHAARVAAESGEALSHARTELERQSVLLDQLGAELQARR